MALDQNAQPGDDTPFCEVSSSAVLRGVCEYSKVNPVYTYLLEEVQGRLVLSAIHQKSKRHLSKFIVDESLRDCACPVRAVVAVTVFAPGVHDDGR